MLFQKTGVQLSECYALRFTDPSLSPYKVNGCFTSPVGDLSVDVSGQVESAQQLAVIAGGAGYSQCRTDTTYVAQGISANANGPLTHQTLCITTGNRIAVCYVTDDTTSTGVAAPALTMDVTVYALK